MLLGVVYHALLFRVFTGGYPPIPRGAPEPPQWLEIWLHSFRLPLFFLISGFFSRMMLEKHGAGNYLRRRWARIGLPLLIGLFTFCPAFELSHELTSRWIDSGAGSATVDQPSQASDLPASPASPLAAQLFGPLARLLLLGHLWFLWYLLLFVTATPWLSGALAWLLPGPVHMAAGRLGPRLLRSGFAPLLLGLISTPALLPTSSPYGWSLGFPSAAFRAFPDFLLHPDLDMMFYFIYFLAGWALHRQREALPSLASAWLPNLLFGLIAFTSGTTLGVTYDGQTGMRHYELIRSGAYTLFCLGTAATAFGMMGYFLWYLSRPSRTWRYLADTALWVYLVHPPLVVIALALLRPLHLNVWLQTALVVALAAAAALLAFEAIVRPTPLVRLFGPARSRPPRPAALSQQDQTAARNLQEKGDVSRDASPCS
jgi:hypothetical protein